MTVVLASGGKGCLARGLRIERAGWHYHVTSRALERRKIFREEAENAHFVELIGEAVERFDWVLHGYVLMGNHNHLLLQTREANLSRSIQWLGQSYSWARNRSTSPTADR